MEKSLFLLSLGSAGKRFVEEWKLVNFWTCKTEKDKIDKSPDDLTYPIASNSIFQLKIKRKPEKRLERWKVWQIENFFSKVKLSMKDYVMGILKHLTKIINENTKILKENN